MAESRALSQWEIDALLHQIPEGERQEQAEEGAPAPAIPQTDRSFTRAIKSYDFRRPDKFSKEQWQTLQVMHETFARLAGASFSSRLRALVAVRLSSIDQGLYEEWQSQVPGKTVCYVLSLNPLPGNIVIEFNQDVAVEVIDRLLGGTGLVLERSRELGELEMVLLRSFASTIIGSLQEMWSTVAPVEPELHDLSLDVGLVQVARSNDVVISAFFEVSIADHVGAMSICVPYTVVEPVAAKLSAQVWMGTGGDGRSRHQTRRRLEALLDTAAIDISVELGSVELPVSAVIEMSEGDTLLLDSRPERPLPMLVDGHPRFLCRPGMIGNQIGVRVQAVVEAPVYDESQDFDDEESDDAAGQLLQFPVKDDESAAPEAATAETPPIIVDEGAEPSGDTGSRADDSEPNAPEEAAIA
ncbi:MAG: flagellar motor switch protein FliM [Dehalococcoidia bacterium]